MFTATRFAPRSSLVDDVSWMFAVFGCRDTVFSSFHSTNVSTVHSGSNNREITLPNLLHLFFDCSMFLFFYLNPAMLTKSFSPLKEINKKSKAFFYFRNLKDNKIKIHFNLIACLAGAHLIFITGIKSAVSCKVSSLIYLFSSFNKNGFSKTKVSSFTSLSGYV